MQVGSRGRKAGKTVLPGASERNTPPDTWILSSETHRGCTCSSKPLSLWSFTTTAAGNQKRSWELDAAVMNVDVALELGNHGAWANSGTRREGPRSPSTRVLSHLSHVRPCDPMDCSPPGSPVVRFSRQEHWSGLPSPAPGHLPDPGIEPSLLRLLHWQTGSLPLEPPGKPAFERTVRNTDVNNLARAQKEVGNTEEKSRASWRSPVCTNRRQAGPGCPGHCRDSQVETGVCR